MAGIVGMFVPSLASLAPKGPSASWDSTMRDFTWGISAAVGSLYSKNEGFIDQPFSILNSSNNAWPKVMETEPSICPSTDMGFMAKPQSWAAATLCTFTTPVSLSISHHTKWAPKLQVGETGFVGL